MILFYNSAGQFARQEKYQSTIQHFDVYRLGVMTDKTGYACGGEAYMKGK